MITIQSAMLVALGFLGASLLGLLVASAFWARAVRLTTARIKQSMPVSEPEIKADRDRLRAEYAIKVHKLETQLEHVRLERARQLIEINRRDASISALETDVVQLKADLEENQNARRVLEQTVADRLPRVEARLAEAKRLLFNRDREIADLTQGAKRHKEALEEAASMSASQTAQIQRLTSALTTRGGRNRQPSGDERFASEGAVQTELETLRTKTREQATLIDRLQRRLGHGYVLPTPAGGSIGHSPEKIEDDGDQARQTLSQAEAALRSVRSSASGPDMIRTAFEAEIRSLKGKAEDQAGEIARLKAALTAFEQYDGKSGGLKESKIALKARLGSLQAQADQQTSTINKLRAELAATHERLARQAAHFMDEMRRIGGGAFPPSGYLRQSGVRPERRRLADRVSQVRPTTLTSDKPAPSEETGAVMAGRDNTVGDQNGHSGNGSSVAASDKLDQPLAAEMPKPAAIPAQRRRLRLLDRITGLAKD